MTVIVAEGNNIKLWCCLWKGKRVMLSDFG